MRIGKKKTPCQLAHIGKSGSSIDQETPKDFYDYLDSEFEFDFDPCPLNCNTNEFNGLTEEWGSCNFVNPPYNKKGEPIKKWIEKTIKELNKGKKTVLLVPCRFQLNYWWDLIYENASEIRVYRQGIKFGENKSQCPFAISIIIFDPKFIGALREKKNIFESDIRYFSYFKIV